MGGYFDIQRDNQSPYFCQACLTGKEQMSSDSRYCFECYKFLVGEAEMLSPGRRPAWIPKAYLEGDSAVVTGRVTRLKTHKPVVPKEMYLDKEKEVLVRTNSKESHVSPNLPRKIIPNLGGRPKKDIPVDLIHKLRNQGLSVTEIMEKLKAQGQIVSRSSISRVLLGPLT